MNSDSAEIPRYYLNFAELYAEMGRKDSAVLYTERLKLCLDASEDDHFKLSAYSFFAGWKKNEEIMMRLLATKKLRWGF